MNFVPSVPLVVVLCALTIAAATDMWKFKVHNLLTLPLLAAGVAYHAIVNGSGGLLGSLMGAIFGFCSLVAFYAIGGMGAGDVKLLAGVGAWLGMPVTFFVFIFSSLAAGCYALVLVILYSNWRETWLKIQIVFLRLKALGKCLGAEERLESQAGHSEFRRRAVPFAPMVLIGVMAILFLSWFGASSGGPP
jgi:prepilin peptidase CpaA